MYLSGYGVELAIKSTEYKAVDDTQVKGMWGFYLIWYLVGDTGEICLNLPFVQYSVINVLKVVFNF